MAWLPAAYAVGDAVLGDDDEGGDNGGDNGGGVGGAVSDAMGTTNRYAANAYDPNAAAFEYGGVAGGADEAAGRYRSQADAAGFQQTMGDIQQNQARNDQMGALGAQRSAAEINQQAAMGNAPSRAEILGRSQSDQAAAAQQSMAASARGPAALAMAQQNAAANTANAQTQIATQSMAQRADEMAQARALNTQGAASYQQGAGAIRTGDQASQQGARQQQIAMTGAEQNVRAQQLAGGQNREQIKAQANAAAQGVNAGISGQNSQSNYNSSMGMMQMVGSAMSSAGSASASSEETKVPSGGISRVMASPEGEKKPSLAEAERYVDSELKRMRGGEQGPDAAHAPGSFSAGEGRVMRTVTDNGLDAGTYSTPKQVAAGAPTKGLELIERERQTESARPGADNESLADYYDGQAPQNGTLRQVATDIQHRQQRAAERQLHASSMATAEDITSGRAVKMPSGDWMKKDSPMVASSAPTPEKVDPRSVPNAKAGRGGTVDPTTGKTTWASGGSEGRSGHVNSDGATVWDEAGKRPPGGMEKAGAAVRRNATNALTAAEYNAPRTGYQAAPLITAQNQSLVASPEGTKVPADIGGGDSNMAPGASGMPDFGGSQVSSYGTSGNMGSLMGGMAGDWGGSANSAVGESLTGKADDAGKLADVSASKPLVLGDLKMGNDSGLDSSALQQAKYDPTKNNGAGWMIASNKAPTYSPVMASPEGTKDPILIGGDYGGKRPMYDDDGRGMLVEPQQTSSPMGSTSEYARNVASSMGAKRQEPKKPTLDDATKWADGELAKLRKPDTSEAERWADAEIAKTRRDIADIPNQPTAVQTASGRQFPAPDRDTMESYLQSTRGGAYEYKDPAMPGASPGVNYGPPSAEDMTTNPIGRAVTTIDPRTQNLAIDKDKALKANMSATSYVNDKTNELEEEVSALSRALGTRRRGIR